MIYPKWGLAAADSPSGSWLACLQHDGLRLGQGQVYKREMPESAARLLKRHRLTASEGRETVTALNTRQ
jgi:hypothetical protein